MCRDNYVYSSKRRHVGGILCQQYKVGYALQTAEYVILHTSRHTWPVDILGIRICTDSRVLTHLCSHYNVDLYLRRGGML